MTNKYKVTLKPDGEIIEVSEGVNLLTALREQNIYIKSSCGGHATCSDCILKVVSGEDYLTPPPFEELKLLGNVFHITKERLACQTCVTGDITVDITKHNKATDEEKLKSKKVSFVKKTPTKIRKDDEIRKVYEAKEKERAEIINERNAKDDSWKKHWEKDKTTSDGHKRLGGGKKPKFFDTDKIDYTKNDYTRPLSEEKKREKEERLALKDKLDKIEKENKNQSQDLGPFKKFRE